MSTSFRVVNSRPEMAALFSDEEKMNRWLEVELAVCETMAEMGEVPKKALRTIKSRAAFTVKRVRKIEEKTRHDVIAFIENLAENIEPTPYERPSSCRTRVPSREASDPPPKMKLPMTIAG